MIAAEDPRECPYVGLDPFEAAHAAYFFGRRQDSKILADHVTARPITVLYGASGIGKSSILNVGLPAALPKSDQWLIVRMRSWQDPERLEQLAVDALIALLPRAPRHSREHLEFAPLIGWASHSLRRPVLLILDQFEEYFLYRDPKGPRALETGFGRLMARRDLAVHVLIALRDDALHQLDQLRGVLPGILDTTLELGRLSDAGVEEAIRGPIDRYNAEFRTDSDPIAIEDGLVAALITDLKKPDTGPGAAATGPAAERRIELPYLQLALTKLWVAEGGPKATALRERTLMDADKLGGVNQIVRRHVQDVMGSLTRDEQALCARIFDRLVTAIGSKIAYPTKALAADDDHPGISDERVEAVLHKLTPKEARILKPVVTKDGLPGFEIFHDVLGPPVLAWRRAFQAEARAARERKQGRLRAAIAILALVVLGSGAFLSYAYNKQDEMAAELARTQRALGEGLWGKLDFTTDDLTEGEVKALWDLSGWQAAGSTAQLREGFLRPLTFPADPAVVVKFGRGADAVWRALGLTWPAREEADKYLDAILKVAADKGITDAKSLTAWGNALSAIPAKMSDEQQQAAANLILDAMLREVERFRMASSRGLKSGREAGALLSGARSLEETREAAGDPLVQTADNLLELAYLPQVVSVKLTDAQARSAVDLLLEVIRAPTPAKIDRSSPAENAQPPGGDGAEKAAEEAAAVRHEARDTLQGAIGAVSRTLTGEQAKSARKRVLEVLGAARPQLLLQLLRSLLRDEKLDDDEAPGVVEAVLGPYQLSRLIGDTEVESPAGTIESLSEMLSATQIAKARDSIAEARDALLNKMTFTSDPSLLETLARSVRALEDSFARDSVPFSGGPVDAAKLRIVRQLRETADPSQLRALVAAAEALNLEFTEEQKQAARHQIVVALSAASDASQLAALSAALKEFGGELTDQDALVANRAVLKVLAELGQPTALSDLQSAVSDLADLLTVEQARAAFDRTLVPFGQASSPVAVQAHAAALSALSADLRTEQVAAGEEVALGQLVRTNDPSAMRTVARLIGRLGGKLSAQQAQAALDAVVRALSAQTDADQAPYLASALGYLGRDLSPAQAQIAAEALFGALPPNALPSGLAGFVWTDAARSLLASFTDHQQQIDLLLRVPGRAGLRSRWVRELVEQWSTEEVQARLKVLQERFAHATDPFELERTASVAEVFASKLELEKPWLPIEPILNAYGGKTDPNELRALAGAIAIVGRPLTSQQAALVLTPIQVQLPPAADSAASDLLPLTVKTLGPLLPAAEAASLLELAKRHLAGARSLDDASAWAAAVAAVLEPQKDERTYLATMVEILKFPTVRWSPVDWTAADEILDALRRRFPDRTELDHDATGLHDAIPWFIAVLGRDAVERPPDLNFLR